MFSDESLSAKWLTYHSDLNPQLYAHETSIRTVVATPKLVNEAFADTYSPLGANQPQTDNSQDTTDVFDERSINDNAIVTPSPDSTEQLISQQFKVHTVLSGETLGSIGKEYGVSENTLIWTNKLSDYTIQPGWNLLIPPTDGILVQTDTKTTAGSLAKKYGVDKQTIMAYNGLADETIEADRYIMIPGGKIFTPKPSTGSHSGAATTFRGSLKSGSHNFPPGYCTWYVATRLSIPWPGNAKEWPTNARAFGAVLTSTPSQGAIIVTTDNSTYGHVGIVEEVFNDGSFTISEMNYKGFNKIDRRTLHLGDKRIRTFIVYH